MAEGGCKEEGWRTVLMALCTCRSLRKEGGEGVERVYLAPWHIPTRMDLARSLDWVRGRLRLTGCRQDRTMTEPYPS